MIYKNEGKILSAIFEDQVRKTPELIAIKTDLEAISYEELNNRANRIARMIIQNISKNSQSQTVALFLEHGADMIVAILAVLKAGKTYVPLAIDFPDNRISFMIEHSQSVLLLSATSHLQKARELVQNVKIPVLNICEASDSFSSENLGITVAGDDLAYILYTSGSTGKPKGVMQTHRNAIYYTRNWWERLAITSADRLTLFSSFCHDGSVQDMFSALLRGATLYPYHLRSREFGLEITEFLRRERITIWHSVPSLFSFFVGTLDKDERFSDLRYIVLGGEPLREHELEMGKKHFPGVLIGNSYGQTESSVNSLWLIDPAKEVFSSIKLGQTLDETKIFIVDKNGSVCVNYEVGEILVASSYLSPGYWQDDALTRQTFNQDKDLGRYYWTGDLGRMLPDGSIEIMGRRDFQVKIRGFRIELGEIETCLLKHSNVREAVVIAREYDGEEKYLTAYYVTKDGSEAPGLREQLTAELPDYMIPSFFIKLEKMPLTGSGKIDRKALPKPEFGQPREELIAPRNEIERVLLAIWADVLKVGAESIGIDSNFFELGGHSLKATTIASRIHRELQVQVLLAEMFKNPTIRGLATIISIAEKTIFEDLEKIAEKEYYDLSYNQKRLWFIQQLDPQDPTYNMVSIYVMPEECDEKLIISILSAIVDRHESLRTGFKTIKGQPMQFVLPKIELPFRYMDFSNLEREGQINARKTILKEEYGTSFDLQYVPLFRVVLLKWSDRQSELIFNMHHIISDGWSLELLRREFQDHYEAMKEGKRALPPLTLQYRDFAFWQGKHICNEKVREASFRFWSKRIKNGLSKLELPLNRGANGNGREGAGYSCFIGNDTKERLQRLSVENNVTPFSVLFSLYLMLLSRFSPNKEVVCAIISASRDHASLQNIVGFFVNSVLFQTLIDPDEIFLSQFKRIHDEVMETLRHQHFPLELIFEELKMKYPEIPVAFNMLNIQDHTRLTELSSFVPYHKPDAQYAKFDIEPYFMEYKNGIDVNWVYRKSRFSPVMFEDFILEFLKIVDFFTVNPDQTYRQFQKQRKKRVIKRIQESV